MNVQKDPYKITNTTRNHNLYNPSNRIIGDSSATRRQLVRDNSDDKRDVVLRSFNMPSRSSYLNINMKIDRKKASIQ